MKMERTPGNDRIIEKLRQYACKSWIYAQSRLRTGGCHLLKEPATQRFADHPQLARYVDRCIHVNRQSFGGRRLKLACLPVVQIHSGLGLACPGADTLLNAM